MLEHWRDSALLFDSHSRVLMWDQRWHIGPKCNHVVLPVHLSTNPHTHTHRAFNGNPPALKAQDTQHKIRSRSHLGLFVDTLHAGCCQASLGGAPLHFQWIWSPAQLNLNRYAGGWDIFVLNYRQSRLYIWQTQLIIISAAVVHGEGAQINHTSTATTLGTPAPNRMIKALLSPARPQPECTHVLWLRWTRRCISVLVMTVQHFAVDRITL